MSNSTTTDPRTILYDYAPSLPAAATFTTVFTLLLLVHTVQAIRTSSHYLIPLLIGLIMEAIGYAGRIWSSTETYPHFSLGPYIIQAILILIAPLFFAASVYMILGRIILAVDGFDAKHSLIRRRLLTKIFVLGDVVAFLVQGNGAGMLTSKSPSTVSAGKYIVVGGLVMQLLSFGCFMVVGAVFYVRLEKRPTERSLGGLVPWRRNMWVLFAASGLIFVRSVFRVAEYVLGNDGYILRHEVFLYVFDAGLMTTLVVLINVIHPSQVTGLLTGNGVVVNVVKVEQRPRLASSKEGENEESDGSCSSQETVMRHVGSRVDVDGADAA